MYKGWLVLLCIMLVAPLSMAAEITTTEEFLARFNVAQTLNFTIESFTNASVWNDTWIDLGDEQNNDSVIAPYNSMTNITQNLTISMWVKMDNLFGADVCLASATGTCFSAKAWELGILNNDLYFFVGNGTHDPDARNDTKALRLANDTWHHIVGVYNNSGLTGRYLELYIDGVNVSRNGTAGASTDATPSFINWTLQGNENLRFGMSKTNSYEYNGSYDEIRLYNRTLSQGEVESIYNSGRIPNASLPSTELIIWYSFNENNATRAWDKSGNGNFGNISGSVNQSSTRYLFGSGNYTANVDGTTFTLTNSDWDYSWINISYTYDDGTDVGIGSLATTFLQILIGFIAITVLLAAVGGIMYQTNQGFSNMDTTKFIKFSITLLVIVILMIVLMNYIATDVL